MTGVRRTHRELLTSCPCGVAFPANQGGPPSSGGNSMAIAIRQLTKHFAGEVSGVDLRKPLTKDEASEIEAGMDKYAVLGFHDQDITDDQQMAFALNFGEREDPRGGNVTRDKDYRLGPSGLNPACN